VPPWSSSCTPLFSNNLIELSRFLFLFFRSHSLAPSASHADITVLVYRGPHSYELVLHVPAATAETHPQAAAVGWEKNASGKVVEQSVDLSSVLDARALATAAAQLNVRRVSSATRVT
jgi:hypothetical protein